MSKVCYNIHNICVSDKGWDFKMKYLAIYTIGALETAYAFDDYNSVVDYINNCTDSAGDALNNLDMIDDDHYAFKMKDGQTGTIEVKRVKNGDVAYEIEYSRNFEYVETRRFKTRENAVAFVHRKLDELDATADEHEDDYSEWILSDPKNLKYANFKMSLVILGGEEGNSDDYRILGVSSSDSVEVIKKAYHKKALENHPDRGGSEEKFRRIQEAYERIIDGKAQKASKRKRVASYDNVDMRVLFKNYIATKAAIRQSQDITTQRASYSGASLNVVIGLIELLAGIFITAASYNSASSNGGYYYVFYGLIIAGVIRIFKGFAGFAKGGL